MSTYDKEYMLKRLCISYPGLRERVVDSVDDWISSDGELMWGNIVGVLSSLFFENISEGNYDNSDELFYCIEEMVDCGSAEVECLITTGLLEGMLNARDIDQTLWRPLLRKKTANFCNKVDEFYNG